MEYIWIAVILGWLAFAGLGTYVAAQKGRSAVEGFLISFFFGPLGVIVVALLPSIDDNEEELVRPSQPKVKPSDLCLPPEERSPDNHPAVWEFLQDDMKKKANDRTKTL